MSANTRQIEFITGVETPQEPATQEPTNPDDLITLDYADKNYQQGKAAAANIAAVRAIPVDERKNGDMIFVLDFQFEYWFDSTSSSADDGFFYLQPDDLPATGRWRLNSILDKQITLTDTTQSTDKDTGAVVLEGGLGVEKNVNIGGSLNVVTSATIAELTVTGTLTYVNTTDLEVTDGNITVNKGGTQAAADLARAGFTVEMSDATDAELGYNSGLTSKFAIGEVGSTHEVVTVGHIQTFTAVKRFNLEYEVAPITTPVANPGSGLKVYAKADGSLYTKNSAGVEQKLLYESEAGAGGGGGSLSWVGAPGSAPVEDVNSGIPVYLFTDGGEENLYATIKVPEGYAPGVQIGMKNYVFNAAAANFYAMATETTLIRSGVDPITSTTNQHTDNSGDIASGAANELADFSTNLTDGAGEINGVAVSPGDLLKVRIFRFATVGTEATEDINFIPDTTEVSFS